MEDQKAPKESFNSDLIQVGSETIWSNGTLVGVTPSTTLYGFTYFSYMIPPYKPESVLILGMGSGVIADLIHKVWGKEVSIIGIDLDIKKCVLNGGCAVLKYDASEYVKKCSDNGNRYDFIVIDLWNSNTVCDFVFSRNFVENLKNISSGLVALNIRSGEEEKTEEYFNQGFELRKFDKVFGNNVSFWKVKK